MAYFPQNTVHGFNRTRYGRLKSPRGERLPVKARVDHGLEAGLEPGI